MLFRSDHNPISAYVSVRFEDDTYVWVASHNEMPDRAELDELASGLPDGEYRLVTRREFFSLPIKNIRSNTP